MLTRVRRGEIVLTAIALTGLAAGLVLTIAKILGVAGPLLICVGIVAGVAAAVSSTRSQVAGIFDRQRQQSESLAAVVAVPIRPVRDVDPFTIGVFPSDLAQMARYDQALLRHTVPPYVPRRVDAPLHQALNESSLAVAGRLVVLRGDPKSGKSRSLWEAVRTLPGRQLLAVRQPDPAVAESDPAFAPLATLAGLDRPVSKSKGRDLVIWVDDAHAHLRRGLNMSTLRRLATTYPRAVIALTIHAHELDGLRNFDPPLHAVLRRPFGDLFLDPELSATELAGARSAYPALAEHPDLKRLPELFAAVNLLIDRYRSHRADQPFGIAVAKAAIDWQRAGMPPGSIDEPTLQELAALALTDVAPNREMDDRAFKRGLDWATDEVAAFAALVRREPLGTQLPRYRAFDSVVSWAHRNEPPVNRKTWDFVFMRADHVGLLGVGVAAYLAAERDVAVEAFHRAADCDAPFVAALALSYKAETLDELGHSEDATAAYDQVIERFSDNQDPALTGMVAMALVNKGATLGDLDRPGEALATYDRVIERFGIAGDQALTVQVAMALFNRSGPLRALGRSEDQLAAYDQVIERFSDARDPALAEVVANALVNKGTTLGKVGRSAEALTAYDQVIEQFGAAQDPAFGGHVADALFNKAITLLQLGRSEDALAAYDQVIARFGDDARAPELAGAVADALVGKGTTLAMLGRSEEALVIFDHVIERFGRTHDPHFVSAIARALVNKGWMLGELGRPEDEFAAYEQVIHRFGETEDPALANAVANALANKGTRLRDVGRSEEALAAYDEVIQRFGNTQDPVLASEVGKALLNRGGRLLALDRSEEALAAYDEVIERFGDTQNPVLATLVAMALANRGQVLRAMGSSE